MWMTAPQVRKKISSRNNRIYQTPPSIISPFYDAVFIIFSPLLALSLGVLLSLTRLAAFDYVLYGTAESAVTLFSGIVTMAHLVIVFFRSHLNPMIFELHPRRFVLAPILLFAAMLASSRILVFVFVLAIWWDVFHSSMQTFGIGRIYDRQLGNDPRTGRRLDIALNLLLYVGPILAGKTLFDHVKHFDRFEDVGWAFFTVVPVQAVAHQRVVTLGILFLGISYIAFYLYYYHRLSRQGYRISSRKVLLFASTALCSIYTWGFNTFGQAFFIMNLFHALQYFALIWWSDKKNIISFFHLEHRPWGRGAALVLFVSLALMYGVWAKLFGESNHFAFSILLTVSIMHFWYDGFIWSVSKRHI